MIELIAWGLIPLCGFFMIIFIIKKIRGEK